LNANTNDISSDNFRTQSDYANCVVRGGEPVFIWNGIRYGVCFLEAGYCIGHIDGSNESIYEVAESLLDHPLGKDKLRDVITQVCVISRNI